MRTQKALMGCAKWLSHCLDMGWEKSALDGLEKIWWEYHDDVGSFTLPEPVNAPDCEKCADFIHCTIKKNRVAGSGCCFYQGSR